MRMIGVTALVLVLAGCSGVKLVQRDGCWVRQTKNWIGHTYEDLGPCEPPHTEWSDDRLTRVVQECIARTDYHWQTRALMAWNKGQPLPERASEASVLQDCQDEISRALSTDNERLKQENGLLAKQLGEIGKERDLLRARADEVSTKLLTSHEQLADRLLSDQEKAGVGLVTAQGKMAEYLGEAAKKASQPAVATANATSSSEGALTTDASNATSPAAPVLAAVPVPASAGARDAPSAQPPAKKRAARRAVTKKTNGACDPGASAMHRGELAAGPKGTVQTKDEVCPPADADTVVVPKAPSNGRSP